MATKVKSLFKGLRYISQIFDEKDEDIQIGFPTDVKHVAHIGWDGPSANIPSWMNEFRSPSDVKSGPLESRGQLSPRGLQVSPSRSDTHKSRLHHSSNLGAPVSPPAKRSGSESVKHTRRRHSKKDAAVGSPTRDSSGSSRHSRRPSQKSNLGPQPDPPLTSDQPPSIPKSSRRKKGSINVEEGSTKSSRSSMSSRSKENDSLTEIQFAELDTVTQPEIEVKHKREVKQNKYNCI